MASLEKMSAAAQSIIDRHLDAIETSLRASGMTRSERSSILEDVENQIREMLEKRTSGAPQENEVRAIIAELDAPESYLSPPDSEATGSVPSVTPVPPVFAPRISKSAVIGALWAIPFFVCVPLFFFVVRARYAPESATETSLWQFIRVQGLLATMTAPFGATIMGVVSIAQIRHSRGRLYGLGLAVCTALLFPLLATLPVCFAVTVIVFAVLDHPNEIFDPSYDHHFEAIVYAPIAWFLTVVLWVLLVCAVTRWIWRRSAKPLPNDT